MHKKILQNCKRNYSSRNAREQEVAFRENKSEPYSKLKSVIVIHYTKNQQHNDFILRHKSARV